MQHTPTRKNPMRLMSAAALCALSMTAHAADVVTINFDDLAHGALVGSSYAAQGVTFANAKALDITLTGSSAPNVIFHAGGLNPQPVDPLRFVFSSDVSEVSIDALDAGENGARLEAFDGGGAMLGFFQYIGVGSGYHNVTSLGFSAAGIRRVDLFQPIAGATSAGEGLVFDNLRFVVAAPVPEPATAALWLAGLAAMGWVGRRRRAG